MEQNITVCAHCDEPIVFMWYDDDGWWVHPDDNRKTRSGKWPRRCWGYPREEEATPKEER